MPNKISRQRRAIEEQDEGLSKSIFDVYEQRANPDAKAKTKDEPNVSDLMQRLSEMSTRLDQAERNNAVADSVRQAPVAAPSASLEVPTLNLEGLPDPIDDSKGYAKAIAERTLAYQGAMQSYQNAKTEQSKPQTLGDPDALWDDFTEQFPNYAENESRIRFATAEVAGRLAKRGVNVQEYMFKHADRFYKDITKEYDKTFGDPTDVEQEDHDQQTKIEPRQRKVTTKVKEEDNDGDDGRSQGIIGGSEMQGPRQGSQKAPGGMIEDLQAIQRKTGYF